MKRALVVAALGIVALAFACHDDETFVACASIPAGGCPLNHGVSCEDPTCQAAYACIDREWQLDHVCPGYEGGAPTPVDAGSDVIEASTIRDADPDAPPGAYGGPGCGPLEIPDCMLGTALSCPSGCCDCEDLFLCQNGGWEIYGSCKDGKISSP